MRVTTSNAYCGAEQRIQHVNMRTMLFQFRKGRINLEKRPKSLQRCSMRVWETYSTMWHVSCCMRKKTLLPWTWDVKAVVSYILYCTVLYVRPSTHTFSHGSAVFNPGNTTQYDCRTYRIIDSSAFWNVNCESCGARGSERERVWGENSSGYGWVCSTAAASFVHVACTHIIHVHQYSTHMLHAHI